MTTPEILQVDSPLSQVTTEEAAYVAGDSIKCKVRRVYLDVPALLRDMRVQSEIARMVEEAWTIERQKIIDTVREMNPEAASAVEKAFRAVDAERRLRK